MPILDELRLYSMALLLLSLVFKIVIIVFTAISVLVVQSLVNVSVEREQFESGICRIMGLTKVKVIISMSLVRCLSYVIPAMSIALVIGGVLLSKIQKILYLDDDEGSLMPVSALIEALLLGILLPIISSINPILNTMKITL